MLVAIDINVFLKTLEIPVKNDIKIHLDKFKNVKINFMLVVELIRIKTDQEDMKQN